jgi:hypothetical protein
MLFDECSAALQHTRSSRAYNVCLCVDSFLKSYICDCVCVHHGRVSC